MKYNYKLRKTFVIRIEYFGGLLLSNDIADRFILDFETTVFLKSLIKYNYEDAIAIVNKVFNSSFTPDIDELLELDIIEENVIYKEYNTKSLYTFIMQMKIEVKKAQSLKFIKYPLYVSIYPTSVCQISCSFCYYKDKVRSDNNAKNTLSISKWKLLIDELSENNVLGLSILGGEPTCYKYIDELLIYTQIKNINTSITTNAVDIKDSTFDIMCNAENLIISVSLQSVGETNKILTGVKAEVVMHNIRKFINNGKIPQINTVVTTQSLSEFIDLLDWCEKIGIEEAFFNIYNTIEDKSTRSFSDYKDLEYSLNNYIDQNKYNVNITFVGCLYYSVFRDELENPIENEFDKYLYGCEAAKSKVEIMPNGDVLPCVMYSKTNDSILFNTLEDIWMNSALFYELRNSKNLDSLCVKCNYYNFCNGGCPIQNLEENNMFKKGDMRCPNLYKKQI
jgi:radical SAM additional 4Fe4S-binding domain